jgi:hypothetical protein
MTSFLGGRLKAQATQGTLCSLLVSFSSSFLLTSFSSSSLSSSSWSSSRLDALDVLTLFFRLDESVVVVVVVVASRHNPLVCRRLVVLVVLVVVVVVVRPLRRLTVASIQVTITQIGKCLQNGFHLHWRVGRRHRRLLCPHLYIFLEEGGSSTL